MNLTNKIIPEIKVINQEKFNCICDKYNVTRNNMEYALKHNQNFIHDILKQIKISFISSKSQVNYL